VKKVTIYDVAREAGVSLATVSRVINGSNVVKESTKNKVLDVINKLDFKPNEIARGLAKSKTTMIAVVFPQALFAHVKDMIGGIGDTSRTLNYNITIHTTDDIGEDNMISELVEKLVKSRVDGVILFHNELIKTEIEEISKYKIPIVVVGEKIIDENIGSIYVEANKITYDIVTKYLEKGIEDIVFFGATQNLVDKDDMILGIKKAYDDKQLKFENKSYDVSTRYEESYPYFLDYFKHNRPKVVITAYDKEGVAVINAAMENGIKIPEDMEVIGMLNTSYGVMCKPRLTSVNIPVYNMGALALRLLTKMLNNEEIESKNVVVRHLLIKRDSTK